MGGDRYEQYKEKRSFDYRVEFITGGRAGHYDKRNRETHCFFFTKEAKKRLMRFERVR
jgi:hypothetical protein